MREATLSRRKFRTGDMIRKVMQASPNLTGKSLTKVAKALVQKEDQEEIKQSLQALPKQGHTVDREMFAFFFFRVINFCVFNFRHRRKRRKLNAQNFSFVIVKKKFTLIIRRRQIFPRKIFATCASG